MALDVQPHDQISVSGNSSTAQSNSVLFTAGRGYLAFTASLKPPGHQEAISLISDDTSLTWTIDDSVDAGNDISWTAWRVIPATTITEQITATWAQNQARRAIVIFEITDPLDGDFIGNTGGDGASPATTATPDVGSLSTGSVIATVCVNKDGGANLTVESGWTAGTEVFVADFTVRGAVRNNDADPSATWTGNSDDIMAMAAEIFPALAGSIFTVHPRVVREVF
jgi:hypothetical protein